MTDYDPAQRSLSGRALLFMQVVLEAKTAADFYALSQTCADMACQLEMMAMRKQEEELHVENDYSDPK